MGQRVGTGKMGSAEEGANQLKPDFNQIPWNPRKIRKSPEKIRLKSGRISLKSCVLEGAGRTLARPKR